MSDPPPGSCSAVDSWHPPRTTGEIGELSDRQHQTNVARAQSCVAAFDSRSLLGALQRLRLSARGISEEQSYSTSLIT